MKVLIVGATGSIGAEVLRQCLAHPRISRVIVFVRRELPADVSGHSKLESVLVKDFSEWPEEVLRAHSDAVAMVWTMGTYEGSPAVDLEYPLAFQTAMARVLEGQPLKERFRYIHLSGKLSNRNQDQGLWFLDAPRKLKGLQETRALKFAEIHASVWQLFIIRPAGVLNKNMMAPGVIGAVMGENWSIQMEELGAFVTYLAVDGQEDSVIENARMVRKGRELLEMQKATES
ncbi:NADH(P)-binding domain-containing [Fusarium albosuccineum]|uniref:NADH(P)-binding domain-containing n=1 Tax=Fusarium albosuccineum TaxID=1237068 RepID=A0A8H4LR65_9HYPO|nr:NADH(P)-binding domain-containing [Fusarium albosuccineum]